jgi:hypothetical protein
MGASTVSARLEEAIIKQLEEIYAKPGTGASVAAEAFVFIRRYTLRELKGVFTKEELHGIIDNLNGLIFESQFQANPQMFAVHLEDGEIYDNLSTRWGFDFDVFIKKIKNLTSAQAFFLQEEIRLFWDAEERNLEEFVERFI